MEAGVGAQELGIFANITPLKSGRGTPCWFSGQDSMLAMKEAQV